jgi:hypothetical protein
VPQQLATMIHEQEIDAAARSGLPLALCSELEQRAAGLGIEATIGTDRWHIELAVPRS